ncbi:amidohydrolase [Salana multivorans]
MTTTHNPPLDTELEAATTTATEAAVLTTVESLADELDAFSHDLHAHPEVGFYEFRTVRRVAELLARHGVTLETGVGGIPTAFRARAGSDEGPQVVITAEYDALPGVGHGCGHNVIAASSIGAFLALAPLLADGRLPGGVTLLGTPAEEGGGGKELLIQAGAFDGFDASVMVHPGELDAAAFVANAKRQVVATFRGKAAHAAGNPQLGRNALDAAVTAYQAVAQLRQHIVDTDRVHGVFVEGGTRPNIVPERAVLEFFLRSRTVDSILEASPSGSRTRSAGRHLPPGSRSTWSGTASRSTCPTGSTARSPSGSWRTRSRGATSSPSSRTPVSRPARPTSAT